MIKNITRVLVIESSDVSAYVVKCFSERRGVSISANCTGLILDTGAFLKYFIKGKGCWFKVFL